MVIGMLILLIVVGFGVLTHDRARFEEKVYKHIPLYDWLLITFFPIGCYIATAILVYSTISRPEVQLLPFRDLEILVTGILICLYAVSGNSIHFTSKVLWRYLDKETQKTAYEVNEIFHGRFSHLLIYVGVLLIMFCICLLEMNHPLTTPLTYATRVGSMFMSIFSGLFVVKMVIKSRHGDWHVTRPLFTIAFLVELFHIYLIYMYNVDLIFHPFNQYFLLFLTTFITSFLLRKAYFYSQRFFQNKDLLNV